MLPYKSLGDLLKIKAKQNNQTCLFWRKAELSFLRLNAISNQVANSFLQAGLQKGDRVAILLSNCPEFVFSFWGCAKAGLVAVPIDSGLSKEEIVYIINDSGAKLLVCEFEQMEMIMSLRLKCPALENMYFNDCAASTKNSFDQVYSSSEHFALPHVSGEDLMSIIYTAGTTGPAKGVMLTHHNYLTAALAFSEVISLQPEDNFLCASPLAHLTSQVACIIAPVHATAAVTLIGNSFSAEIKEALTKHRITLFNGPASLYRSMTMDEQMELPKHLRACLCISHSLPEKMQKTFEAKFNLPLLIAYEVTEASGICSLSTPALEPGKTREMGKPLPGQEVIIQDEEGKAQAASVVGEIVISGPCVAKGYFHDEALTAQQFVDGKFYTNDLGWLDETGKLYFVGRKSDIILKGGEQIQPFVIEEVLLKHPAIEEVAVIGLPDPAWGEEIVAFVVVKDNSHLDPEDVIAFCSDCLSDLKCPGMVKLVDALPKTYTGKVQKAWLRSHYGSPVVSN